MRISSIWKFRFIAGKVMMVLALAAMIGSIDVVPALGKDDHKDKGKHDKGRYEQRGRGYDHDRYVHGRPYGYYGYRERDYYPPPPVIYAPPPQPGISIFFPPIVIR